MTYSAVEQPAGGGDLICKLSLAATKNPSDPSAWKRLGPLFPVRFSRSPLSYYHKFALREHVLVRSSS